MIVSKHTAHVDWYQFTVKFIETDSRKAYELNAYKTITYALQRIMGVDLYDMLFTGHEGTGSGYEYRYKSKESFGTGVRLYHGGHEHCLVVMTGQVCQRLQADSPDVFQEIIELTNDCCSRVDLAVTVWTETGVDEYVGDSGVQMARYPSASGTTYYAGSRQSDSYTRIYRYNPPHPRADSIRIEHEYKGKAAKACAAALLHTDVAPIAKQRAMRKGLDMDFMKEEAVKLVVGENRPKSAERTLYWLSTSVRPALERLVEEGTVTADELFALLIEPIASKER